MEHEPLQHKIEDTLLLMKKFWVLILLGLYAACLYNEYRFPGFREEPLEGEAILWKMQRVLYLGLLGLGLLIDIVQARIDRDKAFIFLFASLILGALSTLATSAQFRIFSTIFG